MADEEKAGKMPVLSGIPSANCRDRILAICYWILIAYAKVNGIKQRHLSGVVIEPITNHK
jgi:hypothetical protein